MAHITVFLVLAQAGLAVLSLPLQGGLLGGRVHILSILRDLHTHRLPGQQRTSGACSRNWAMVLLGLDLLGEAGVGGDS